MLFFFWPCSIRTHKMKKVSVPIYTCVDSLLRYSRYILCSFSLFFPVLVVSFIFSGFNPAKLITLRGKEPAHAIRTRYCKEARKQREFFKVTFAKILHVHIFESSTLGSLRLYIYAKFKSSAKKCGKKHL